MYDGILYSLPGNENTQVEQYAMKSQGPANDEQCCAVAIESHVVCLV